jgi:hypothetical protein
MDGEEVEGDYQADEEEEEEVIYSYAISDEKIWMWINSVKELKPEFKENINEATLTSKATLIQYYTKYFARFGKELEIEQLKSTREANLKYFTSLDKGNDDFWFFFTIPLVPTVYFIPYSIISQRLQDHLHLLESFEQIRNANQNKKSVHLHLFMHDTDMCQIIFRTPPISQLYEFNTFNKYKEWGIIRGSLSCIYPTVINFNNSINICCQMIGVEDIYFNVHIYELTSFMAFVNKYKLTELKNRIKYQTIIIKVAFQRDGRDHFDCLVNRRDIRRDEFYKIPSRHRDISYCSNEQKNYFDNYKRCVVLEPIIKKDAIGHILQYL